MAEQMKTSIDTSAIDWSRWPTMDQFQSGYGDTEGGRARDYLDYQNTLNAWLAGPQPKDFANKTEFATAQKRYLATANKMLDINVQAQIFGEKLRGEFAGTSAESRNRTLRAAVERATKEIPERMQRENIPNAKKQLQDAQNIATASEQQMAQATQARDDAKETRMTQLAGFNIPVPGERSKFAVAPGGRRVTYKEWQSEWSGKSELDREKFRNILVAAGVKNADFLPLSMEEGGENSIEAAWNSFGLFLGRQAKKNKFYDAIDVKAIKEFGAAATSGDGGGGPSAAQVAQAKAQAATGLRQFYLDNGLPFTEKSIDKLANDMAYGRTSFDKEAERLRKTVLAKQYPEWSEQINAGYSVRQLAEPYIAAMASDLELDEDDVKVTDPLIQAAIQTKDEKGAYTSMTLRDFRQALRKDERWQNTQGGSQWIADVNNDLLRTFGLEK